MGRKNRSNRVPAKRNDASHDQSRQRKESTTEDEENDSVTSSEDNPIEKKKAEYEHCKYFDVPEESLLRTLNIRELSVIVDYEYTQTETTLTIDVPLASILQHPLDLIKVNTQPFSLQVKIRNHKNKDLIFQIHRLSKKIFAEDSSYLITENNIEIKLRKVKPVHWETLFYMHPSVISRFNKDFTALIKLPSDTYKQDLAYFRNEAEKYVENGVHKTDLLRILDLPSYYSDADIDPSVQMEYPKIKIYLAYITLVEVKCVLEHTQPEVTNLDLTSEPIEDTNPSDQKMKADKLSERGNFFIWDSKYAEAIVAYTAAIEIDPLCDLYYLNRAIAYYRIEHYDKSLEDLSKCLSIDPYNSQSHLCLGMNFTILSFHGLAFDALGRAKHLAPNNKIVDTEFKKVESLRHACHEIYKKFLYKDVEKVSLHWTTIHKATVVQENVFQTIAGAIHSSEIYSEAKDSSQLILSNVKLMREEKLLACNIFYLLALLSYYEDEEEDFHKYFKKCLELKMNRSFMQYKYDKLKIFYMHKRDGDKAYAAGEYKEALNFYMESLKLVKVHLLNSKLSLCIAKCNIKLNEKEEAMSYIDNAIFIMPTYYEALVFRGKYYLSDGNHIEAFRNFITAYTLYPSDEHLRLLTESRNVIEANKKPSLDYILESAQTLLDLSRSCTKDSAYNVCDEAIASLTIALKEADGDLFHYVNRAVFYIFRKRYRDALKDAEEALKLNPLFSRALYILGICLVWYGQPAPATKAFQKAIKLSPNFKDLKIQLFRAKKLQEELDNGNLAFKNKDYDNARYHFSNAKYIGEGCSVIHTKLMDSLKNLGQYDDAISCGRAAIPLIEVKFKVYYLMGLCYYFKGNKNEALTNLGTCLSLEKDHTKSLEVMKTINKFSFLKLNGDKAMSQNKFEEALKYYSDGLVLDQNNKLFTARFYLYTGLVYLKRKQYEAAVNLFTSAIAIQNNCIDAYIRRAESNLHLTNFDETLLDLEKLQKMSPIDHEHQELIDDIKIILSQNLFKRDMNVALANCKKDTANIHFHNGKYELALTFYSDAISVYPKCPSYYVHRSVCHRILGNYSDALNDAKEATIKDPKYVNGYLQLGRCHLTIGNAEKAKKDYEKAKSIDSKNTKAAEGIVKAKNLVKYMKEGNDAINQKMFATAYENYNEALKIAMGDTFILFRNAECLIYLHKLEQVADLIQSIPLKLKSNPVILCIKALYCYHSNDITQALKHLELALELDPLIDSTKEIISRIQLVQEAKEKGMEALLNQDLTEAFSYFHDGLELDSENYNLQAEFHYHIGIIRMKWLNLNEALISFTRAIEFKKDFLKALEMRAVCYEKENSVGHVIQDYAELFNLTTSDVYLERLLDAQNLSDSLFPKDHYEILEVPRSATNGAIRKAYKELALKYHPDRTTNKALKVLGEIKFKHIQKAYSTLIDAVQRDFYDNGDTGGNIIFAGISNSFHIFISNSMFDQIWYKLFNKNAEKLNPYCFGFHP